MVSTPNHVAIIMDGNGRWARAQGRPHLFGHQQGTKIAQEIVNSAFELKIPYLTLFSFSLENWNRPSIEVKSLMQLFERYLKSDFKETVDKGIKVQFIGNLTLLPKYIRELIYNVESLTKKGSNMCLSIAVSYGGRQDIVQACQIIAQEVQSGIRGPETITSESFREKLWTKNLPDLDLLIRTSGEYRVSNFFLWEVAYSELYFTKKYWPDFTASDFMDALRDYETRERRYGKLA